MSKPVQTNSPQGPADTAPMKRGQSAQAQRDKRSKAALKANMARRKAQVRARGDQHGDHDADQNQQGDNETSQDAGPDAHGDTSLGTPETGQQAE